MNIIYSRILKFIYEFPQKFQQNHKEFTQEEALVIEDLLKEHIETNLFQLRNTKKLDDQYFNENYVKQTQEKFFLDYSIYSIHTMFKILKKLENQSLMCKDPELLLNEDTGIISEKKLNCFLERINKPFLHNTRNLVDNFIQSHIVEITQELYDNESAINNYEIENKLSLSLFLLKKIIKDYSFYFDKKPELERIFTSVKKFKEYI